MQKLLNSFSINRDAGGGIPMIDPIDEKIISIRQRIARFKKDHPELYESENNEQRGLQQHTTRKNISETNELKRALLPEKKSTTI